MHADRANRLLLALVGLLAVLLGAGGLLAAYGVFGSRFQHRLVLDNQFVRFFRDHGGWLWPAIAGAAAVVLLLCLLWLIRLLFSSDRTSTVTLDPPSLAAGSPASPRSAGRTSLNASALAQVVAAEISGYSGVRSARARMIGTASEPELVVDLTADGRAEIAGLVNRVQQEAVTHARTAVAPAELQVTLHIGVDDRVNAVRAV